MITPEQAESLRKGIAPYSEQRQYLLDLLRDRGELSAAEFDEHFSEVYRKDGRTYRRAPRWFWPAQPGSIMLGIDASFCPTERKRMLHLMQILVALGEVEVLNNDGQITYRLPESNG